MQSFVSSPVFEHRQSPASLWAYGNAFRFDPQSSDFSEAHLALEAIAQKHNLSDILWQRPPTNRHPDRRFTVALRSDLPKAKPNVPVIRNDHRFDGVILTQSGQTVAIASRDCPLVKISGKPGEPVAVLHCGRDALQGFDISWDQNDSVIRRVVSLCKDEWSEPKKLHAVVTLGIAPEHFPNERYRHILHGLRDTWGKHVLRGTGRTYIDLLALIRAQLRKYAGMMTSQIEWDGLDTYSDSRLASLRAGHNGYHNLVVVSYE